MEGYYISLSPHSLKEQTETQAGDLSKMTPIASTAKNGKEAFFCKMTPTPPLKKCPQQKLYFSSLNSIRRCWLLKVGFNSIIKKERAWNFIWKCWGDIKFMKRSKENGERMEIGGERRLFILKKCCCHFSEKQFLFP